MKGKKETKPSGLLALLRNKAHSDDRPEGWKTLAELIVEDVMPETTARDILNKALASGLVESKKFKSPIGGGFAMRLNYREKPYVS